METWKFDDIQFPYCDTVYNQNIIDRLTKGDILPFPYKGDHEVAKKYRCITLLSTLDKIYKTLLLNHIETEIEKMLWKNQNGFWRNRSTTSQILSIRWILEEVGAKKKKKLKWHYYLLTSPRYTISKHESKNSLTGWRHRLIWHRSRWAASDTLAPYVFIIFLDYVLRTSIYLMKKMALFGKGKELKSPARTITDMDYADDMHTPGWILAA